MKKLLSTGHILVITSAFGFSFIPVLAGYAYAKYNVDPITLALMRTYMALPFFIGAIAVTEGRKVFSMSVRETAFYAILGIVCLGFSMLAAFYSVKLVGASVSTIIIFTYPVMTVALMIFFFKEKGSLLKVVAALITFLGLLLVLKIGGSEFRNINISGVGLALFAALLFALYHALSEKGTSGSTPLKTVSLSMIIMGVAIAIALGFRSYPTDAGLWIIATVLGAVCGFLSMLAFQYGLKKLGAAKTALFSSLGPLFTAAWAYIVLGETLSAIQIIGMLIVIAGVISIELDTIRNAMMRKNGKDNKDVTYSG